MYLSLALIIGTKSGFHPFNPICRSLQWLEQLNQEDSMMQDVRMLPGRSSRVRCFWATAVLAGHWNRGKYNGIQRH